MSNNYQLLINKLDQFIRKYYTNQLIKGSLYSVGLVVLAFITINLLEYFMYFSSGVRMGLFYGFLTLSGIVALFGVILPLLQIFKLGSVISHQKAAQIIGQHFGNVKDKLLNVLQLKEQSAAMSDASLIEASINQKINDIKLVPFTQAIDLSKNRKYIKYALLPLLGLIGIVTLAPNLIPESSTRILQYTEEFTPDAPFKFEVSTPKLEVVQFDNLTVDVQVEGTILPNEVDIHFNNFPYKLKKNSPSSFSYTFNKVQKETDFYLEANGVRSKVYTINVIPKPTMLSFDAQLDYPSYTGKTDETLRNSGDMVVPAGTKVLWRFEAQNTDEINMKFGKSGKLTSVDRKGENSFTKSKSFYKNSNYSVYLSNEHLKNADSISYNVTVIPDLHPSITAEEKRDSSDKKYLYFLGDVSDDYGIKSVNFKYKIEAKNQQGSGKFESQAIDITAGRKAASYTHTWDLNRLNLNAGDKLTYFFEVWDNDAVSGSKFARSQMMTYELPTIEDLDELVEAKNEEIKDDLKEMVEESKKLKQEVKDIKEKLIQKKDLNWEDKAQIEELLQQHKEMQNKVEQMQENFSKNLERQDEYKEKSESVMEKQEKLEELMEELMTDELKELMEKLEALLDELKKDDAMQELEDFEMTDEQMEMELDRMLELFKQLEFEQKMNETIDKLNELAEEEEKLAEETENMPEGSNSKEQEEKQKEIEEEFEKITEDIKELDEMSEELDQDMNLEHNTQEQQQEISNHMQQSMQQMQQQQKSGASENQKQAAQKMQQMANNMQMMQMQQQQEQHEEDMQAIRQLLENLVQLSMEQEKLMNDIDQASINTPRYTSLTQQQYKLKDDAELVEDSLVALSKRVFQLEAFITTELAEVNRNMSSSIEQLADRQKGKATTHQQFVMTGVNNLALMLDEAMQQMQQQMAMQMQGNQMCQNPGNKPGGMKGMGKMQQQLNDQIQKMQQQMAQGKMPGGQKGMSKEAAQMAAKQAAIRKALEEISQQRNKDGKGNLGDLDELTRQMEQTEQDLVNKRLTSDMLQRQNDILQKLLKAADAERERELDDKRKSETAQQITRKIPPEIEEYLKKRQSEVELYKTVPPSLKPHYRKMVEEYFKSISF